MLGLHNRSFRFGGVILRLHKFSSYKIVSIIYLSIILILVLYFYKPNLWDVACENLVQPKSSSIHTNWQKIPVGKLKTIDYVTSWDELYLNEIECHEVKETPISERNAPRPFRFHYICPSHEHIAIDGFVLQASFGAYDEKDAFEIIYRYARSYPDLLLLDIGANVGFLSIPLANAIPTVRVIAVEPIDHNIRLLTKAVILNNLEDRFLILHHAIHDEAFKVLRMISYKNALTLARLDTSGGYLPPNRTLDKIENNVTTITFDEILPLVKPYTRCIVKIDVEGFECVVVSRIEAFLLEIYVPMIVMETDKITEIDVSCVQNAFSLLQKHGYVPYSDRWNYYQGELDWDSFKNWKHINTIWIKKCLPK